MARRTFFSFHYKPDVTRAQIVRNSWVTKVAKGDREGAGFFDSSVFEEFQRQDDDSLKRFLREGLKNTSVTCVLVGSETAYRRWVRYEIFRSFICGNGLLAIRIHSVPDLKKKTSALGANPLDVTSFIVQNNRVSFRELDGQTWKYSSDVPSMELSEVVYNLGGKGNHTFSTLFPIYDWNHDGGYTHLGAWIEKAAMDAGR